MQTGKKQLEEHSIRLVAISAKEAQPEFNHEKTSGKPKLKGILQKQLVANIEKGQSHESKDQETLSDGRMYAYTILNSFYTNAVVTLIFSSFFVEEEDQKGQSV